MKSSEFDFLFEYGKLDNEYMEYIQENADPEEWVIHNGDSLLAAFEAKYLFNEFRDYKITEVY